MADQRSELFRYTFDLRPAEQQLSSGRARAARCVQRPLEFPCVAPAAVGRRHSHAYACGSAVDHPVRWGPAQTLVKLSCSSYDSDTAASASAASAPPSLKEVAVWAPGPRCFTQEPVFVPKKGTGGTAAEDDGWLLALVHDAGAMRTKLVILDAKRIENGPVATLTLRHAVPFGLHGSWSDDIVTSEA